MPAIVVAIVVLVVVVVPVVASGCVAIVVMVDRCRNSSIHPLEILQIPEERSSTNGKQSCAAGDSILHSPFHG